MDKYLKLIIDTKINHLKDKKLNIVILPGKELLNFKILKVIMNKLY